MRTPSFIIELPLIVKSGQRKLLLSGFEAGRQNYMRGKVVKFATRTTALSQVCQCGGREKKVLGSRWHRCSCGVTCQRDLYSAYLVERVFLTAIQKWLLDFDLAKAEWPSAKLLIDKALTGVVSKPCDKKRAYLPDYSPMDWHPAGGVVLIGGDKPYAEPARPNGEFCEE